MPSWSGYFASPFFMAPCLAFLANLGACSADRFFRELRRGRRRHGPDLLHLGLIVAIVGSLVSFSERDEGVVALRVGDTAALPGGGRLTLTDFRDERYEDGRPRDWTSTVSIGGADGKADVGRSISVNAPLRLGSLSIYQSSYGSESSLRIVDREGNSMSLAPGEETAGPDLSITFIAYDESGTASLVVADGAGPRKVSVGRTAAQIGPFHAVLVDRPTSILRAVSDPGFPIALGGLALVALGTALTFFQKIKEGSA